MNFKKTWVVLVLGAGLLATTGISLPFQKGPDILSQASQAMNQIAKKSTPAVVSISAIKLNSPPNHPFRISSHTPPESLTLGVGSGIIVRPNGIILTNHHVVRDARKITVSFDGKNKLPAQLIGGDPKTDLAVLQLTPPPKTPLPTLAFGRSDQTQVGDWIIAVGSPYGLNRSVTSGIISAVGRGQLGMLDIEDFIQTDAAINPGNSGGPLLNSSGEMIGINTAIFSQTGGFSGIGFAIPSLLAETVFDQILKHGRVIRGWMGIAAQDLNEDLAVYFQLAHDSGALVSDILPLSPADQAHIQPGDVILTYKQIPVQSARHLKSLVANTPIHTTVPLSLERNHSRIQLDVFITEQPGLRHLPGTLPKQLSPTEKTSFGIVAQELTPEFSRILQLPKVKGVLITDILVGSPAFEAGLAPGDIILQANQREIRSEKELILTLQKMKRDEITLLYIQRGPEERVFIPIRSS